MKKKYLDAAAFTSLFRNRLKNYAEICVELYQMVLSISKRFWFHDINDRRDSESFSLEYVILRMNRFSFARGKDAFTYFTSMISRAFLRSMRRRKSKVYNSLNFSDCIAHSLYYRLEEALDFSLPHVIEDAKPYSHVA